MKRILVPLLVVAAALLFLHLVEIPGDSRLSHEISNAGHVPLFGIVALALLAIVRQVWPRCATRPLASYGIALVVSAALGAGMELIQYWGPRDADFGDILRNVAGAAAFLAIHAGSNRSLFSGPGGQPLSARRLWRLLASIVLLAGLAPLIFWATAFQVRNQSFPVICRFDSFWHRTLVDVNGARFEATHSETVQRANVTTGNATELIFTTGRYPGIELDEVYPDWTGFDSLLILFDAGDNPPDFLWLRIDDHRYRGPYTDRFNSVWSVHKGHNRLAVGLDAVRRAPRKRLMNMSEIAMVILFADSTASGKSIWLQEIRLR